MEFSQFIIRVDIILMELCKIFIIKCKFNIISCWYYI